MTDEIFAENMSIDKFTTGTLDAETVNVINFTADNIVGGELNLSNNLTIGNNGQTVLSVDSSGQIILNVDELLINGYNPESDSVSKSELAGYLRYIGGTVYIGDPDQTLHTEFSNDSWAMVRNGEDVMYLEEDNLYIKKARFTESARFGNFGYFPRTNGSLDFRKVMD